ncbi:MAG: flagellar hook-associated protein FlgK [Rhodobacteraceae bacterium]|nr:flagellar hook-associated protein FlgK [Paracoccaceae bacterium]
MSIAATFANALSGLTASARAAQTLSSNIANATTPGFARRELELTSASLGGTGTGVAVVGVTRVVNRAVLGELRLADAAAAGTDARATGLKRIEEMFGLPDEAGSLADRLTALEAALAAAAARPDAPARLDAAAAAAAGVAAKLNGIADALQALREQADAGIAGAVAGLNADLAAIDRLNADILSFRALGRDVTALFDQRQALVDRVATLVPLREIQRPNDQIALVSTGGAILLDTSPAVLGFTATPTITADMTIGSGALSGLTLGGRPVAAGPGGLLAGGRLEALFALRDVIAPAAQAEADAVARNLIERVATPDVDPTLAPGDPGLFTDGGAAFLPAAETGLAGRIALNAAADPARGGASWRLRDGLAAALPGPPGEARLLDALAGALAGPADVASGAAAGRRIDAGALAAAALSAVTGARQTAEDAKTEAAARAEGLRRLHLQDGVDSDAELQTLMLVEQAWSANARVLQVMDALVQRLIDL